MALSDRESSTPDRDLSLYQLHSRYARLAGLRMEESSRLWQEMKGLYPSRESHMAALFSRLPGLQDPARKMKLDQVAEEGEDYLEEVRKENAIGSSPVVDWSSMILCVKGVASRLRQKFLRVCHSKEWLLKSITPIPSQTGDELRRFRIS